MLYFLFDFSFPPFFFFSSLPFFSLPSLFASSFCGDKPPGILVSKNFQLITFHFPKRGIYYMVCAVSSAYLTIDFFFEGTFCGNNFIWKKIGTLCSILINSFSFFAFKVFFNNKSKVSAHYKWQFYKCIKSYGSLTFQLKGCSMRGGTMSVWFTVLSFHPAHCWVLSRPWINMCCIL